MSLEKCLKRFGKAIDAKEGAALKEAKDKYLASGMAEAEADRAALRDAAQRADQGIEDLASQIEAQGGKVIRPEGARTPLPVGVVDGDSVSIMDANEVIDGIDKELDAIDELIRCAF